MLIVVQNLVRIQDTAGPNWICFFYVNQSHKQQIYHCRTLILLQEQFAHLLGTILNSEFSEYIIYTTSRTYNL